MLSAKGGVAPVQPLNPAPSHVAIIMDGNGRWATKHGLPRSMGHRRGADALQKLLVPCKQMGLRYLTLYAFSSENWNRPVEEVNDLMGLFQLYIEREMAVLHQHQIRLRVIGDLSKCSQGLTRKIEAAIVATADYSALNLTIAFSYGSRQEITAAVRRVAEKIQLGTLTPQDIDEKTLAREFYTFDLPDPDLLIRTGGDHRLSNFLLWQTAYTELYFTPILWPDFSESDLKIALEDYSRRERRYGTI
jgi:undecaprenyl diphosphate synthase